MVKCCDEVLWESVVEKCCGEIFAGKWCEEVLWTSVVKKCCGEVL